MLGHPKFKLQDRVKFTLEGKTYNGNIYIIDPYGTFENDSDVSYDIMVNNWGDTGDKECLFKHIEESLVSLQNDE